MGKVACAYDNSVMESFFGSMQIELLDRRTWTTPDRAGQRDLRMDRSVLQPHPAALSPRLSQSKRLRNPSHPCRCRGMITTPKPSGKPGTGHSSTNRPVERAAVLETATTAELADLI